MKHELKDYLNSINQTKKNLMDEDESYIQDYPPYIINRCLSGHLDCIFYVNEMNKYSQLDKKLQYDFYLNTLRQRKRYSPWLKKEKLECLDLVKEYFRFSDEKAKKALEILTEEDLDYIKKKMDKGGSG